MHATGNLNRVGVGWVPVAAGVLALILHGEQMIETDQWFAWTFVITPLTLEIIEAVTFKRCDDHRQGK